MAVLNAIPKSRGKRQFKCQILLASHLSTLCGHIVVMLR